MISSTACSEFDVGPGGLVLLLWVESSWIRELTIVVLGVEVLLDSVSNSEEVLEEEVVGVVHVEVVLEVLEHVHVIVGESVSSDSWEGEGGVIELSLIHI